MDEIVSPKSTKQKPRGITNLAQRLINSDDMLIEAAKVLVAALLGSLAILGYSYSAAYYGMFGVAVFDLGMGFFDYLFRGLFFLISLQSALLLILALFIFTVLIVLARRSRNFAVEIAIYLFAFSFLGFSSVAIGRYIAALEGRAIASGGGVLIQCEFKVQEAQDLYGALNQVSESKKLRFIARDEEYHYIAAVSEAAGIGVKSYAIPNSRIVVCSMFNRIPEHYRVS